MNKVTIITFVIAFIALIHGVHAAEEFPPSPKPGVEVEMARRDYQELLYAKFRVDPSISQEFPGIFRLSDRGGNKLVFQFYRVTSPHIQERIVEIVKQTIPETGFVEGKIEFYRDRIEESGSNYRRLVFIDLLTEITLSVKTEQGAAANP